MPDSFIIQINLRKKMCFSSLQGKLFDINFTFGFSLPWDQETPLGYFGEICISMICIEAYLLDNGALVLLFISMCLHHQAFYKMFQHSLLKLNRPDKNRNDKKHICNLIRFHISVKE